MSAAASLSRQLLTLPQELEGVSLPPQVAGGACGVVRLAVPHALESAAAPRSLPPVSLVRARWWGEDRPGSLFRPRLLVSGGLDGAPDVSARDGSAPLSISPRAIAMRYPVRAPADRLLEYFQDMKALRMDVIDRVTRKKVGCCSLSLLVQNGAGMAGVRAEERLATLRKENALCEIVSTEPGEEDVVLGYLAVDFDIEWAEDVSGNDANPLIPDSIAVDDFSELAEPEPRTPTDFNMETPRVDEATELETSSSLLEIGDQLLSLPPRSFDDERRVNFQDELLEVDTPDKPTDATQSASLMNIQHLIEKGKALQNRMERAVQFIDPIEYGQPGHAALPLESSAGTTWRPESRADSASSLLLHDIGDGVAATADGRGGEATFALDLSRSNDVLYSEGHKSEAYSSEDIDRPTTAHVDSMELMFEQLELEPALIDQLRQLRDPSSATSRFSPVKITVSHTEVPSLFAARDPSTVDSASQESETIAFAVTTSLRKRQWRPNCSKVARVEIYADRESSHGWSSGRHIPAKRLVFRVVCENESDAERQARRQERGLFPLPTKSIELSGSVDAGELLDRVLRSDAWVTTISLFSSEGKAEKTLATQRQSKGKKRRKSPQHPLGHLQVKFRLFAAAQRDEGVVDPPGNSMATLQNPELSESSLFETSIVDTSEIPSPPVSQNAKPATETPLASPSQESTRKTTAVRTTPASPRHERRLPLLSRSASHVTRCREQLQFAVMIAKAVVTSSSTLEIVPTVGEEAASFVTIQYSVPYHFSNRLSVVRRGENVERRAKRKLMLLRGAKHSTWVADFAGHSNVIPSRFHADAADYFDRGMLILEVWRGTSKEDHGALLGVAKISTREFGAFMRDTDLVTFCDQSTPFVSVESAQSIENPFTGKSSGLLRLWTCIGTAEQILVWTSTLPGIITLQAAVRGFLCRLRYGTRLQRQRSRVQRGHLKIEPKDPPHVAKSAIDATSISVGQMAGANNNSSDVPSVPTLRVNTGESRSKPQSSRALSSTLELVEVRFGIRRCWRECFDVTSEARAAAAGQSVSSSYLGCEVQCCMRPLPKDASVQTDWSSQQFSLWWDSADQKLNTYFEAPLPFVRLDAAKGNECDSTLSGAGWGGLIDISLIVRDGLFGSSPDDAITGAATLNLDAVSFSNDLRDRHRRALASLDVPILWNRPKIGDSDDADWLPDAIPLQLSFELQEDSLLAAPNDTEALMQTSDEKTKPQWRPERVTTPDSLPQLVPAEIALAVKILDVSDLKNALAVRAHLDTASSGATSLAAEHLRNLLLTNARTVQTIFDIALGSGSRLDGDNSVFTPSARRWRTPSVLMSVAEGDQDLLPGGGTDEASKHSAEVLLRVLSNQISSLKHGDLEITLLVICDECDTLHELGTATVPTAPVLFRPNGLQGSFPLRVGRVFAGTIGIHCHVHHNGVGEAPMPIKVLPNRVPHAQDTTKTDTAAWSLSPKSPDDTNVFDHKLPSSEIEVAIEEARNILVLEREEPGDVDAPLGSFVSWRVVSGASDGIASPTYHPVARTHVAQLTSTAKWHVSRSLQVNSAVWSNPVLEVSLWQQNHLESLQQCVSPPTAVSRRADDLGESQLLGKARVDLSLLGHRWAFVDGWYHVLDARGINRGQVKVRVNLPDGAAKPALDAPNMEVLDEEELLSTPGQDTSFDTAMREIHNASKEVQQRLSGLKSPLFLRYEANEHMHDEDADEMELLVDADSMEQPARDDLVAPDVHSPMSGQQDKHANMLDSAIVDESSDAFPASLPDDDPTNTFEHSAISISKDDGEEPSLTRSEQLEEALVIDTGMFMPITLASFGIEEVELSPWSEASAKSPGFNAVTGESEPPRFELLKVDSDDNDAEPEPSRRADEDEDEEDDLLEVEQAGSYEGSIEHSGDEDPLLELSTSDVSDDTEREEAVSEPCFDRDTAETDEDADEASINGEMSSRELSLPDQTDDSASIEAHGLGVSGAGDIGVGITGVDVSSHEILQPVAHKLGEHDGEDQGSVDCMSALSSLPVTVDAAVQVDLDVVVPRVLVEEAADHGMEFASTYAHSELLADTSPTQEVQPPEAPLDSLNQDTAAPFSAPSDPSHELDTEARSPQIAVETEDGCASDQVRTEVSLDPSVDSAALSSSPTPIQSAPGNSNDKLDLIVSMLNEILVVCMSTAHAGAASGAQPTSRVADSSEPSVVASSRGTIMCDAQTQVDEDLCTDISSLDSSPPHLASGASQQTEVKTVGPPDKVDLERESDSLAISAAASWSSTSSSEEAFRAARTSRAPDSAIESTERREDPIGIVAELRSPALSPPLHPVTRPPLPLRADSRSSTTATVDRLARELSSLYDRKPLTPVSATFTSQRSSRSVEKSRLRFPTEKRTPLQFPLDSETERIARIMQGSLTYWMKESEDGSGDSLGESEDSDSDYLF